MTPLKFLYFSLMVIGDIFILLVLMSAANMMVRKWVRTWFELYFQEKEKFLKRLSDVSFPYDARSKMTD